MALASRRCAGPRQQKEGIDSENSDNKKVTNDRRKRDGTKSLEESKRKNEIFEVPYIVV
jgi:hypothetical protein